MASMRPIDELADDAAVQVHRNAALVWLRDAAGVEYQVPKWFAAVLDAAWNHGYDEAQQDIREALGFVHQQAVEVAAPEVTETDLSEGGCCGK